MTPIVIGVDLSLTATGISTPERTYVLDTPASKVNGLARIKQIMGEVLDAAGVGWTTLPRPADLVVLEQYAFRKGDAHAHELGELGGVVKMALAQRHVKFCVAPIASVKLFATGKGNANKGEMLVAAERSGAPDLHGNDNAADAWWLRRYGLYALGHPDVAKTQYRDKAVQALQLPQSREAV